MEISFNKSTKSMVILVSSILLMGLVNLFGEGAGISSAKFGSPNMRIMNQSTSDMTISLEASGDINGQIKQRYTPRVFSPIGGGKAATSSASEAGGANSNFHVGFQGSKMLIEISGARETIDFGDANTFSKTVNIGGKDYRIQGTWTPAVWVIQISQ